MKKITLLLAFTLLLAAVSAQKTDERLRNIEKEFEQVLDTFMVPGFAIAIVEKDQLIYSGGFGFRDHENKTPADANTLFAIGSCTKAFTSSLIGMLENEDKLALDKSPSDYIQGFRYYNDELNSSVTIRDLMSHRTGLPRHDLSWYFFPGETKRSLLERVKYQEPFTGIRERFHYNNFMYLALGVTVEEITGRSWEENVREKIFEPLGMERSNLSISALENSENAARPYRLKNNKIIDRMDYYHIARMSPAGSINSSVNEMSRWIRCWINGGKFEGKQVIPANFLTEAISSHMVVSAALPSKDSPGLHLQNYGYGWFLSSYKGHYRVEHGGNIDGFSASTCFFPADSIGIVVLANQNASAVPGVVRNIATDRMLGLTQDNWIKIQKNKIDKAIQAQEEAKKSQGSNKKEGTGPSHELKDYPGEYSNKGYGTIKLILNNDSLFASLPRNTYWLKHYHYDVFEPYEVKETTADTTENTGMLFNFTTNTGGDISGFHVAMEPTLDPLFFKKIPETVELAKEKLDTYTGEYELMGSVITVYLKGSNKLFANIPGQPEYELLAVADNRFRIKGLEGYSVEFTKGDDNSIREMKFIQPNGTFVAKRK